MGSTAIIPLFRTSHPFQMADATDSEISSRSWALVDLNPIARDGHADLLVGRAEVGSHHFERRDLQFSGGGTASQRRRIDDAASRRSLIPGRSTPIWRRGSRCSSFSVARRSR